MRYRLSRLAAVRAATTIEGIRAGRDEVLERGVEVLLGLVEE